MGLNTLGENKVVRAGVFVASMVSGLLTGCSDKVNSKPEPPSFPQCGPSAEKVEISHGMGRFGTRYTHAPDSVPFEVEGCVEDAIFDRNCSGVREEARRRLNLAQGLFKCEDDKPIFVGKSDKEIPIPFTTIPERLKEEKGDCKDVRSDMVSRIRRAMSTEGMECDENGNPHIKPINHI